MSPEDVLPFANGVLVGIGLCLLFGFFFGTKP